MVVLAALLAACGQADPRSDALRTGVRCVVHEQGPPEEYVYLLGADEVLVVNPRTCTIAYRIPVAPEAVALNASLTGRTVFVAHRAPAALTRIDTDAQRVMDVAPLPIEPRDTRFDGRKRTLWVRGDSASALVDTYLGEVVAVAPIGAGPMAMTGSQPPTAWAVDGTTLVGFDAATGARRATLAAPGAVLWVEHRDAADETWVCTAPAGLWVLPGSGREATATPPQRLARPCAGLIELARGDGALLRWADFTVSPFVGGAPSAPLPDLVAHASTTVGPFAAIADPGAGALWRVDEAARATRIALGPIDHAPIPAPLRSAMDGRHAYQLDAAGGRLYVVDVVAGRVRGVVDVGPGLRAVVVAGKVGGSCC